MKVLIVSYWYSPSVSPRAFRWASIAEAWAAAGAAVDVVSSWSPGLAREEVLGGVRLHRPGVHIRGMVRAGVNWMIQRSAASVAAEVEPSRVRASIGTLPATYRAARWIYDRTWKQVYWPDDAALWKWSAQRCAERLLEGGGYDALVTVSFPFTDHLVGLGLHRKTGAPWLVDVGDPFCFLEHTPTNNHRLYRRLNYAAERRVFQRADRVAVTTDETRDIYARIFPESAAKIHVIPPLLSPLVESEGGKLFPEDGRIRLVFAGNLYRTIREPDPLLRLFRALLRTEVGPRLELHFLGNVRDCWSSFEPLVGLLDRQLFLHGTVNHDYALEAMRGAQVLVNIGNDTAYQLPSKVVEYAALGKPVLNIVGSSQDSSAGFFRGYPAALGLVAREGEPSDEEVAAVARFVAEARPVPAAEVADFVAPYRVPAVAEAYRRLLQEPGQLPAG